MVQGLYTISSHCGCTSLWGESICHLTTHISRLEKEILIHPSHIKLQQPGTTVILPYFT